MAVTSETRIWLDSASSTPLSPEVAEAMAPWQRPGCGANPSSLHAEGRAARRAIEEVREGIADRFQVPPGQIHFTASATEANNLALTGALRALPKPHRPHRVIASAIEHDSVRQCLLALEHEGIAQITWISATSRGLVDIAELERRIASETTLATLMHVNNETGAIQPISEWGGIVRKANPDAVLLCDAVQAAPRIPLRANAADLITLSGHKIHGPAGVGVLIRLRPIPLAPLVHGGPQEGGLRAGTESVANIVGLGVALRLAAERLETSGGVLRRLEQAFLAALRKSGCSHTEIVPPDQRAPGMLCLAFPLVEAGDLVIATDLGGIALSAGSACHSGAPEPSHVLEAMGIDQGIARRVIRVVFHRDQSPSQAEEAAGRLAKILSRIRRK